MMAHDYGDEANLTGFPPEHVGGLLDSNWSTSDQFLSSEGARKAGAISFLYTRGGGVTM